MRVAVTGAAGLLGRATVPLLAEQGHEVLALGRAAARLAERVGSGAGCRATAYEGDDLREALEGCGAVVHLAGRRGAAVEEGLVPFVEPNLVLTERVLRCAAAAGVEVACLASSISVYSAGNDLPFAESQEALPASAYGLSKLATEHLGRQWGAATGGRAVSLRLASLVGAGDETARDRMLATFLDRARRGEPLVLWGEGGGGRDLLYVRDAARAVVAALDPSAPGGALNIGSGRPHAFREVAATVNAVHANPGGLRFDRSRREDQSVAFMDCRRAEEQLGWTPRWTLRSALEDMRDRGDLAHG
ncbi:MAG: NAD(P)-dependent oxidoreductase [Actinomycetota bacterium]